MGLGGWTSWRWLDGDWRWRNLHPPRVDQAAEAAVAAEATETAAAAGG